MSKPARLHNDRTSKVMTKVVLYNAISLDGFIAGEHDETPWSDEEWRAFQRFVKSCDACILGRKTYEIMHKGGEFIDGPRYIVATSSNAGTGDYERIQIRSAGDLPRVDKIGLIGGGDLNGRLAEMNLIDEIILDVESMFLGTGTRLFGDHDIRPNLKFLSSVQLGPSTLQTHYEVMKLHG